MSLSLVIGRRGAVPHDDELLNREEPNSERRVLALTLVLVLMLES